MSDPSRCCPASTLREGRYMYELQLTSEIEVYAIYNIVSVYFKTARVKLVISLVFIKRIQT